MKATKTFITLSFLLLTVSSCNQLFDPETDDQIKESEYISSNTELYTGFIGIMTKVQAVGDKEILLTDTRAELLEPTVNATTELYNIYNYADNLQGNSYANPAGYYEVIIACNDYLSKVAEYRTQPQVDQEKCNNLIASTIRIKVWAYKTLGEIYGEAAWFDEPIASVEAFLNGGYEMLDMQQITDKCLDLLENGYMGVTADGKINWIEWLDPDNINAIDNSPFRQWDYVGPAYEGLYAELCLWKAAYLDRDKNYSASRTYYKSAVDILCKAINEVVNEQKRTGKKIPYWLPSEGTNGHYDKLWLKEEFDAEQTVSFILYNYKNKQTNGIINHFCADADFLLAPSEAGEQNFLNNTKNPGGNTGETRYKYLIGTSGGNKYIAKFRPVGGHDGLRTETYKADVRIYIYRSTQYFLMLAEALNNLSRFTAMKSMMNGFSAEDKKEIVDGTNPSEWEGITRNWTRECEWDTPEYSFTGIRAAYKLSNRDMWSTQDASMAEAKKHNDIEIMHEVILDLACEGKTYPWMNRLAVRYNDLNIVADEICPKYVAAGKDGEIRAKILSGGNWVKYNLK